MATLAAIGVALGLLLGILGGGGSILTVPALVYVAGIAPKSAIAMSLAIVGVTSAVGAVQQWRAGAVAFRPVAGFAVATMLGAFVGGRASAWVRADVQLLLLAAVMLASATAMWRGPVTARADRARSASPTLLAATGLSVGVLTGIVGIGGGFVIVPALVVLAGLPMPTAIGTSLAVIAVNSAAGFAGVSRGVVVDWMATSVATAAAVGAVLVGARVGRRLSAGQLRTGFAAFLVLVAIFLLWKNRAAFGLPVHNGP
ncbi:MAG: sulfite exporter TauE/SafE family protein [Gemmatimonadaceae bacterium]|nr:sulfite exporter TauE/SafE family protein [Gemmatimonadaceae bacterium]